MRAACRRARQRILARVDGTASLEDDFRLEEHLRSCAACAAELARAQAVEAALLGLDAPDSARPDVEAAVEAIRARLASAPATAAGAPWLDAPPPPPRRRAWRAVVAAALVAAAGAALWLARAPRRSPGDGAGRLALVGSDPGTPEEPVRGGVSDAERAPEPAAAGSPADDPRRLREARLVVREELALAAGEEDPARLVAHVTAAAGRRLSGDWDLVRLVEELALDPEPPVALAALRFLEREGDRLSVPVLRTALARPALFDAALAALAARGDAACPALEDLLARGEHDRAALEALVAVGSRRAARVLADALRVRPVGAERRALLLDALVRLGAPAAESFVALAADGSLPPLEAVRLAGRVEDALPALDRVLAGGGRDVPVPLFLLFAGELQPPGLLARVEELCGSYEHAAEALDVLARWRGREGFEALLRVEAGGRVADDDLALVLRRRLAVDATPAADFARLLLARHREHDARRLLDLLLLTEAPESAPALAVLGLGELLGPDLRQSALLAIAELGRRADVSELRERLERDPPSDSRLFACGLVGVHAAAGPEAVAAVLERATPRGRARVLQALERGRERDSAAAGLTRVTRALEGAWSDTFETWQGLP